MSKESQQQDPSSFVLRVAFLGSEWGSTKGGLSTLNRELAIQLAKIPNVSVTFLVPKGQCKDGNKKDALEQKVNLVEVERCPGYDDQNDWLISPPQDLAIDIVVGHGVKLGRPAQFIRKSHQCKWVQVVHIAAEELGMHKMYPDAISKGEDKHQSEKELCDMADLVVPVGPKLAEVISSSLRSSKEGGRIFPFTPGIFREFSEVKQAAQDRKTFCVLVFGRGDQEDFEIKGFDIAAKAVSELDDVRLVCVGAANGKQEEMKEKLVKEGISPNKLTVRKFIQNREELKKLFCEVDLAILPSRTEAFGLTALEALSAGLPILACRNSGFGNALSEVPFGSSYVVDSDDVKTWANWIDAVRKRKRNMRLQEAENLRSSYEDMYSWEDQCKCLVQEMLDIVHKQMQHLVKSRDDLSPSDKEMLTSTAQCEVDGTVCKEPENVKMGSGKSKRVDNKTVFGDSEKENKRPRNRKMDETVRGQSENEKKRHRKCEPEKDITGSGKRKRVLVDSTYPEELIELIKRRYKRIFLCPFPWCDDALQFKLSSIFTSIQVVRKTKERTRISDDYVDMPDIFQPHEECDKPRVVQIEGKPWIGKTTYCEKLAYDWSESGISPEASFPDVELLLLLKCRDMKSDNIEREIDCQLLPQDAGSQKKETFFHFIRTNQSKTLLVLDGLDELPAGLLDGISLLIEGKIFSNSYVLFTARHKAGMKVRKLCDSLFEIVGFSEEKVNNYVRRYFGKHENQSLADKMIQKLNSDSRLRKLAVNPGNIAVLCLICEDLGGEFPDNEAIMYDEFVAYTLKKCLGKKGVPLNRNNFKIWAVTMIDVGRVALKALQRDQLFFSESELKCESVEMLEYGFLWHKGSVSKIRSNQSHEFTYKIFQEYFAALFLALTLRVGHTDADTVFGHFENIPACSKQQVFRFFLTMLPNNRGQNAKDQEPITQEPLSSLLGL